jgi:hypothetical protein
VGSPAVRAVPPSGCGLHVELPALATNLSFETMRLRCRLSASPQSPAPDAVVVALPTEAMWSVVQWRRVRPALARTDDSRPESHCRCSIPMRSTPLSAETGGGHSMGSGVGPSGGVGKLSLHPLPRGSRARPPRDRSNSRLRTPGLTIRAPPSLRDLDFSENNDWTRGASWRLRAHRRVEVRRRGRVVAALLLSGSVPGLRYSLRRAAAMTSISDRSSEDVPRPPSILARPPEASDTSRQAPA